MSDQRHAVKREATMLSRYIGLLAGRLTTVVLSFLCLSYLSPACVYISLFGLVLPLGLQSVLSAGAGKEPDWQLPLTLKKYHFTALRFRCEKIAAPIFLVFLLGWQYALSRGEQPVFWGIVPALLFLVNVVVRILTTILFRIHLHREFTGMKQLLS